MIPSSSSLVYGIEMRVSRLCHFELTHRQIRRLYWDCRASCIGMVHYKGQRRMYIHFFPMLTSTELFPHSATRPNSNSYPATEIEYQIYSTQLHPPRRTPQCRHCRGQRRFRFGEGQVFCPIHIRRSKRKHSPFLNISPIEMGKIF